MTPALCHDCGSTTFTPHGEAAPEIIRWDCAEGHPVYWHTREGREVTLTELHALIQEWHNNG